MRFKLTSYLFMTFFKNIRHLKKMCHIMHLYSVGFICTLPKSNLRRWRRPNNIFVTEAFLLTNALRKRKKLWNVWNAYCITEYVSNTLFIYSLSRPRPMPLTEKLMKIAKSAELCNWHWRLYLSVNFNINCDKIFFDAAERFT